MNDDISVLPIYTQKREGKWLTVDSSKELAALCREEVKDILLEQGILPPTAFFVCEDSIYIATVMMGDEKEKDMAASIIRAVANKVQAQGVAFASEAWMATPEKGDDITMPSMDPNRREIVLISASWFAEGEDKEPERAMEMLFMQRDEQGELTGLIQNDNLTNGFEAGNLAGRFVF
jgi:hypothetical protein